MADPQAERIFEASFQLAGAARIAEVKRLCGEDQDLQARCLQLLALADGAEKAGLMNGSPLARLSEGGRGVNLTAPKVGPSNPIPADEKDAQPPIHPPDYTLIFRLAAGGFGEVWIARPGLSDRPCAIKVLFKRDSGELEGLRRFKEVIGEHPGLVPIDHIGESDGLVYLVMPLAEHIDPEAFPHHDLTQFKPLTLTAHINRRQRIEAIEVSRIGADLANAIAHLHAKGRIHGDVKPDNVFKVHGTWRLGDYSVLKTTEDPSVRGSSPDYQPPDKADHGTQTADQYALGLTLYRALTGHKVGQFFEFQSGLLRPEPEEGLEALQQIILRATMSRQGYRYPSMTDMERALKRVGAPPPTFIDRLIAAFNARPRTASAALAGAAIILVVAAVMLGQFLSPPAPPVVIPPPVVINPPVPQSPLVVNPLLVDLYRGPATSLGPVGRINDGHAAYVGDWVKVSARSSREAHAYLLAFTPGSAEPRLCLPCDADGVGLVSATPAAVAGFAYPPGEDLFDRLEPSHGPGLFMYALVVSTQPLPSYAQWVQTAELPAWNPQPPAAPSTPATPEAARSEPLRVATAFIYDGLTSQALGTSRDPGRARLAPPQFDAMIGALRAAPGVEQVHAIVFTVLPSPGP